MRKLALVLLGLLVSSPEFLSKGAYAQGTFTGVLNPFTTANTWTATQNLNGGIAATIPSGFGQALNIAQTPSGTTSATTNFNILNLTDTATITGVQFGNGFEINHSFGGSSVQGGRQAFIANAFLTATTNAGSGNRNYVGVVGVGQSNVNDNGTNPAAAGTSAGAVFGGNFVGVLGASGATSFLGVSGAEFNARIVTGASSWAKSLAQFSSDILDRVQGSVIDTMLWAYNQNDAGIPGWNTGLLFDNAGGIGRWPIKSTGTIIATGGGGTAANGIDFSNTAFSGSLIKGRNFNVDDPTGNVSAGFNLSLFSTLTLQHSGNYSIVYDGSGSTQGLLVGNASDPSTYLQNTTLKFRNIGGGTIYGTIGPGWQIGAAPTGGDKGANSINIQGTIWTNGTQGIVSRTCTVNQALTLIFTNGILTGGTCVS